MHWYVLYVTGGKEQTVAEQINKLGIHALVPSANKLHRSSGDQWSEHEYLLFPSYVFLECTFCADTWYKVNNIPHVVKWLGDKKDPSYLDYIEVEWIKLLANDGNPVQPSHILFKDDGTYIVKDGLLSLFKSNIKNINRRQKTARVVLSICEDIKEIVLSIEIETEEPMTSMSSVIEKAAEKEIISDESAI